MTNAALLKQKLITTLAIIYIGITRILTANMVTKQLVTALTTKSRLAVAPFVAIAVRHVVRTVGAEFILDCVGMSGT